MAKPINYSAWDHIEVSDDEDETHPNVDTGSLFRWRHQARMERMDKQQQEHDNIIKDHEAFKAKFKEAREKLDNATDENRAALTTALEKLKKEDAEWDRRLQQHQKDIKMRPWNIDTICKDGRSKTMINSNAKPAPKKLTDEEKIAEQRQFIDKYEADIKKYGLFKKYDDSQQFLEQNLHLVSEYTANYLCLWCIDLELQEKCQLMEHVAHQCVAMNFMMELAKTLDRDPQACVRPFFSRLKYAQEKEREYLNGFLDELTAFKERVRERAKARMEEARKEAMEEERQKRIGPGGLDPVEVFESLPKELQDCFESKDVSNLKDVLAQMDPKDAERHMKRCVDSGMWVLPKEEEDEAKKAEADEKSEEPAQEEGADADEATSGHAAGAGAN